MKDINLSQINYRDLLSHTEIAQAFKDYLMEVLEYNEDDANFVVTTDFANPYDTPFIIQDSEGKCVISGKEYEVVSCRTDFCVVGLFHLADIPPFEFYMFFDKSDLPDHYVSTYRKAKNSIGCNSIKRLPSSDHFNLIIHYNVVVRYIKPCDHIIFWR